MISLLQGVIVTVLVMKCAAFSTRLRQASLEHETARARYNSLVAHTASSDARSPARLQPSGEAFRSLPTIKAIDECAKAHGLALKGVRAAQRAEGDGPFTLDATFVCPSTSRLMSFVERLQAEKAVQIEMSELVFHAEPREVRLSLVFPREAPKAAR